VLDGTDAVMLSGETATGDFPVETVEAMARICREAERSLSITLDHQFLDRTFTRIDQSIAMAAIFAAYHLDVKAVAALTTTGSTTLWMSRLNCGLPIFGLTEDPAAMSRMTLFREVFPLLIPELNNDRDLLRLKAEERLLEAGVVAKGDLIVLSYGDKMGQRGSSNTISIVRVGDPLPEKVAH
jgi:pyruvate kinase